MILVSDFDRTLFLDDDLQTTNQNFSAVKSWHDAGHQFAIATGRTLSALKNGFPLCEQVCDYFILDGGAVILDRNQSIMSVFSFDPSDIKTIVSLATSNKNEKPLITYYNPYKYSFKHPLENTTKLQFWFKNQTIAKQIFDIIKKSYDNVFLFCEVKPSWLNLDLPQYSNLIEISTQNLNKKSAISKIFNNTPPDQILTVGDDINDLEMVQQFNGYVIKNSIISTAYPSLPIVNSVSQLINTLMSQ